MGKIRGISVVEHTNVNDKIAANATLDNKIAAAALMSRPGWSSAADTKTSLPDAISVGAYTTGRLHCGYRGIYPDPATVKNQ